MTRRRDVERHRHSLAEIRNIMNSMKTLAFMETRKLSHFLDAQHTVVQSIETAAADFLSFYPEVLPEAEHPTAVCLVIGTERGFCGDFNHALLKRLDRELPNLNTTPLVIGVGRKLSTLLEDREHVTAMITGASVVEEVNTVLNQLVAELIELHRQHGSLNVYCLYQGDNDGIELHELLPPFREQMQQPPGYAYPPLINLEPTEFLTELTDQYLFALLHEILFTSLMMENHQRVAHLEGAISHLDEEEEELTRKSNALRQEEIIEEIEVILLNTDNTGGPP